MQIEDIKAELKGYFIHREDRIRTLAFKQGNDFKLLTDNVTYKTITEQVEVTPMQYLLIQINNQLLNPAIVVTELTDVIELIDFNIFNQYDKRELEIKKHKAILEKIRSSKSIFGRKKDFKLIYVELKDIIAKGERHYYVIKDDDAVAIDSALLDDVGNAVEVENIDDVRKALKDDFVNLYSEKYNEECRKWESLN